MSAAANADVRFRAVGDDAVVSATKKVQAAGDQALSRMGSGARQVASGFESIARAGKLTGDAMKQVVSSAADMAFSFGKFGPIAGAIGILGITVYSFFQRTREEIKKTQQEALEFKRLLIEGSKEQLLAESKTVNQQIRDKQKALDELIRTNRKEAVSAGVGGRGVVVETNRAAIAAAEAEIATLNEKREAINRTVSLIAQSEQRTLDNLKLINDREKARNDLLEARKVLVGALDPSIRNARSNFASGGRTAITGLRGDEYGLQVPNIAANVAPGIENAIGQANERYRALIQEKSTDMRKATEAEAEKLHGSIVNSFASAIENGFTRAFSGEGLSGLFKGFGQTILQGLGQVFIEIGKSMIQFGVIMEKLKAAIAAGPFGAGIGAVAMGAALIALGASMSAVAGGSHHGSISGGSFPGTGVRAESITRITVDPTSAGAASRVTPLQPMVFNIFGARDPVVQRQLQEAVRAASRRGDTE